MNCDFLKKTMRTPRSFKKNEPISQPQVVGPVEVPVKEPVVVPSISDYENRINILEQKMNAEIVTYSRLATILKKELKKELSNCLLPNRDDVVTMDILQKFKDDVENAIRNGIATPREELDITERMNRLEDKLNKLPSFEIVEKNKHRTPVPKLEIKKK